jgi:hypothetical protein
VEAHGRRKRSGCCRRSSGRTRKDILQIVIVIFAGWGRSKESAAVISWPDVSGFRYKFSARFLTQSR